MSRMITLPVASGVIALAATCLTALPAQSAEAPSSRPVTVTTVASGLFSPLSLEVTKNGTRYFSQSFAGTLHRQVPGKAPKTIYANKYGAEVGAVSVRDGRVRFAITGQKGNTALMGLGRRGNPYAIANLSRYEKRHNPDAKVVYGFRGLPAECAAQLPDEQPASYPGIVESHPYATAQSSNGTTYVADAAGNSILSVGPQGAVRTVAVLPPAVLTVTAEFAEASNLPACVVGRKHWFEGVPTDVEVGPGGILYVSTLPGGPEDGSLGAAASVYRINPRTGRIVKLAGGLTSATGLAVSPAGHVYVAELFRGRIARIAAGTHTARTFANIPLPGDVSWTGRGIFATANVLTGLSGEPGDVPKGKVVKITLPRG